jgi:archaellum biogenesis protein FlaJ (TadC family)
MLIEATAGLEEGATSGSGMSVPMFSAPNVELFRIMIYAMIIVFSFINAFSIGATDGGHKTKIAFYLALMLALAGLCLIFLPGAVAGIFQIQ